MNKILRQFALERKDEPGLNYAAFRKRVSIQSFNETQYAMLEARLELLESFMNFTSIPGADSVSKKRNNNKKVKANEAELKKVQETYAKNKTNIIDPNEEIWSFEEGSLTIVDLSCPFVDDSAACALFNICIALFLEERGDVGRIVALDEAHKVRD